jgi:hypothetical protein
MSTNSPVADIPVPWRKSSYSTSTGNCVEAAPAASGVIIRHSKHLDAGTITFPSYSAWTVFVRDASEGGPASTNRIATITKIGTDTLVRSMITEVELRFDEGEWSAFLAGAAAGEFDFGGDLTATR